MSTTLELEISIRTRKDRAAVVAQIREIANLIESGRSQGEHEWNGYIPDPEQRPEVAFRFELTEEID